MMAVNRVIFSVVLSFVGAVLAAAPIELKVTGNRVNLRARPLADAEVAGQVSSDEILFAPDGVDSGAEWVKVRPPQSVDLWIYSALVTDGIVNAADTYVRCGPGPQFKPVGKLQKGDRVERRGAAKGDWLRIAPVESAELFISAHYVAVLEKEQPAAVPEERTEAPSDSGAEPNMANMAQPDATVQPEVAESNVSATAEAIAVPAEMPVRQIPETPKVTSVSVPRELSAFSLSPSSRQGVAVTLSGRLEKLPVPALSGFVRYQLVERNNGSGSSVICRIAGLAGQWRELVGSDVEVRGNLWTLSGDPVPVIHAESALRVASWEM